MQDNTIENVIRFIPKEVVEAVRYFNPGYKISDINIMSLDAFKDKGHISLEEVLNFFSQLEEDQRASNVIDASDPKIWKKLES